MSTSFTLDINPTEEEFLKALPAEIQVFSKSEPWPLNFKPYVGSTCHRVVLVGPSYVDEKAFLHVFVIDQKLHRLEACGLNSVKKMLEMIQISLKVRVTDEAGAVLGKDDDWFYAT